MIALGLSCAWAVEILYVYSWLQRVVGAKCFYWLSGIGHFQVIHGYRFFRFSQGVLFCSWNRVTRFRFFRESPGSNCGGSNQVPIVESGMCDLKLHFRVVSFGWSSTSACLLFFEPFLVGIVIWRLSLRGFQHSSSKRLALFGIFEFVWICMLGFSEFVWICLLATVI